MGLTLCRSVAAFARVESSRRGLRGAALVGMGSSIFHPESSRVAHMASGGRHGLAQSFFQVGGNVGSSLGPLLAALVVVPHGQSNVIWFSLLALVGIVVLAGVGDWYRQHLKRGEDGARRRAADRRSSARPRRLLAGRSRRADLLEVFLSRQPDELLHLLPDQKFDVSVPDLAISSVPFPLRGRASAHHRRTDRRPLSGVSSSFGFQSSASRRLPSLLPLRQSVLDRHPHGHHRARSSPPRSRRSWFTRRNWCRAKSG